MSTFFDNTGKIITLGYQLGRGGEGTVFDVYSKGQDIVAKIYHQKLTWEKQNKLKVMVHACDDFLKKYSTWPIATLHPSPNGPICGFIMPKMIDFKPVHQLYNPESRKKNFPDKDWAFLINVARNIAAAFETIHRHNFVIGDVNPNLVFFSNNGIVRLIDCDSYQIVCSGRTFFCDVGVPNFTPPELQTHQSFRGILRTKNHDNFGLALLIFHILLMGRHPFSGIFFGNSDLSLEKSIEKYNYVYSKYTNMNISCPPLSSIPINILPDNIINLFEKAFNKQSSNLSARPTAYEWLIALDELRKNLVTCKNDKSHVFYKFLKVCPWCSFYSQKHILYFLPLINQSIYKFDINLVWQDIVSVLSPGPAPEIIIDVSKIITTPLKPDIKKSKNICKTRNIIFIIIDIIMLMIDITICLICITITIIFFLSNNKYKIEKKKDYSQYKYLKDEYDKKLLIWKNEAGEIKFNNKLDEIKLLKEKYLCHIKAYNDEKNNIIYNKYKNEINIFLNNFYIKNNKINAIGALRKSILERHGIRTAADIEMKRIMQIHGFGLSLTQELVNWRKRCENKFKFDLQNAITPNDIRLLSTKYDQTTISFQKALINSKNEILEIKNSILVYRKMNIKEMEKCKIDYFRAEKHMSLFT